MYGALITREILLCVGGGRCLGYLADKRETSGFKSYNRGMKDETDGHLDSTMEEWSIQVYRMTQSRVV